MIPSFTLSGHLFLDKEDSGDDAIDYILMNDYAHEFVLSDCFDPYFVADLMGAGFLIMSEKYSKNAFVLMPKHHVLRSVVFFNDLHVSRSIKKYLPRYELRFNSDYDKIVGRCVDVHGDGWLTPPLLKCMQKIRCIKGSPACPVSFGLYKDGGLVAGEFGVVVGGVYTSYSGYFDESSSGRVQLILTAKFLERMGFAFWDLGMPLDYKYTLGAHDVDLNEFVGLFRGGRGVLS